MFFLFVLLVDIMIEVVWIVKLVVFHIEVGAHAVGNLGEVLKYFEVSLGLRSVKS